MKDKQIAKLIAEEKKRQKSVVNLIASENYVSKDVLAALGSELTNKYSEGYAHARYYGGNIIIDKIEEIAIERALKLFKLKEIDWMVNVQALSGSPANLAVYAAVVPLGGKIMGLSMASGGHLTHAQAVSFTGKVWKQVPYEVDQKTGILDYAEVEKIAIANKPDIIVCGFTAYSRLVDFKKFRDIANKSGALLMCDMSHFAGLVAGEAVPSPFNYVDIVTHTTHKTLRGPRNAIIYAKKDARGLDKKINKAIFPGLQGGPHENNIAAVAVALKEAGEKKFRMYAKQVIKNAQAMAKEFQKLGWNVVSGGTDTHMFLLDTYMDGKGVSGKIASQMLEKVGIIVNMNTIPNETRTPMDPSGIRIGTPAETTRGKKEKDMIKIAQRIDKILKQKD
jgi:glycine hydroxymethyltransferase